MKKMNQALKTNPVRHQSKSSTRLAAVFILVPSEFLRVHGFCGTLKANKTVKVQTILLGNEESRKDVCRTHTK